MPDFIILETTGAANPLNLTSELEELRDLVKFDSVTTLVDAANISETLRNYSIAGDQIRAADIIILNKTDSVTGDQLSETKDLISGINRRALIVEAEYGRINPAIIYDSDLKSGNSGDTPVFVPLAGKNHSADGLSSVTISLPESVSGDDFIRRVKKYGPEIFRMKGLVRLRDQEGISLFQYVAGRYDLSDYSGIQSDPFLVLIGRGLKKQEILENFSF